MTDRELILSKFFPYQLAVLSSRVSKRLARVYESRFALSTPEWRIIAHLSRCPKISVRDIHNCVNLEKSRVSRAVERLVKSGLVKKSANKADQRLLVISLTEKGTNILTQLTPDVLHVEDSILDALTEGERELFLGMMERLLRTLDHVPKAPERSKMDTQSSTEN